MLKAGQGASRRRDYGVAACRVLILRQTCGSFAKTRARGLAGFQKLWAPLWSPYNQDHSISGSMTEPLNMVTTHQDLPRRIPEMRPVLDRPFQLLLSELSNPQLRDRARPAESFLTAVLMLISGESVACVLSRRKFSRQCKKYVVIDDCPRQ